MSLSSVQLLAAESVVAVAQGRSLTEVLDDIRSRHAELTAQQRGALQDLAFGVQRFSGSLNAVLDTMLGKPLRRTDIRSLMLVALYQLAYTRNAEHAVVNEAVGSAARIGKGQYRALANALLRRFLREREALLAQAAGSDLGRYNLPEWWLQRLRCDYPQHWTEIVAAFNSRPPMTLRINRRRMDAAGYLKVLQQAGLDGMVLGEQAVMLSEPVPVSVLPLFAEGVVSVQDWGAQQAAYWLAVSDDETVLDACAAPGGKSGHLLEWADCRLTALDIDAIRLQRVRDNLQRLGLTAQTEVADAAKWASCYDGNLFDAVLADVPCTASGVVRRHPDIKWLRRPQDAAQTATQQTPLLDGLWRLVKPGGRMLLATCSLFAEENDRQLQQFLQRHPDACCRRSETLLPNERQDGFYYALIDKLAEGL